MTTILSQPTTTTAPAAPITTPTTTVEWVLTLDIAGQSFRSLPIATEEAATDPLRAAVRAAIDINVEKNIEVRVYEQALTLSDSGSWVPALRHYGTARRGYFKAFDGTTFEDAGDVVLPVLEEKFTPFVCPACAAVGISCGDRYCDGPEAVRAFGEAGEGVN